MGIELLKPRQENESSTGKEPCAMPVVALEEEELYFGWEKI